MDNTTPNLSSKGALCYVSVKTKIPKSLPEVVARFDKRLFDFLAPAFPKLKIDRYDGQKKGDVIWLRVGLWPIYLPWSLHIIADWKTLGSWGFEDEGAVLPPPLKAWRHQHRLCALNEHETEIEDYVGFSAGPPWLTSLMAVVIRWQMKSRRPLYLLYFCNPDLKP